jgi:hypothetical protein
MDSIYPKLGLRETKGRGKEGKKIANNDDIHHICVGILKIVKQYRIWGKGRKSTVKRDCIDLSTMHVQV